MAQVNKKAVAATLALIMAFEGYSHRAYLDPVGIPTICRGHTGNVHMGDVVEDCDELTQADLRAVISVVGSDIPNAPPEIIGSFADFCYNVGVTKCKASTLYSYLKSGEYRKACDEFPKWIYAKGKPLPGLIRRRQAERNLCLQGVK